MKKLSLLFFMLPFLCISCTPLTTKSIPTSTEQLTHISSRDQLTLKKLDAKKQGFSYENDQLLLGDSNKIASQKQLFLIYNRSLDPIVLDFPQGHIGASAGIMQMIQPGEWYAYFYVKNKDYRRIEPSPGKFQRLRPTWTCQQGNPDYQRYNSCKKYLSIYSISYNLNQLKEAKNTLDYKLLNIFTYHTRTRWLTSVSYPSVSRLLMNIRTIVPHQRKK